jgi:outer membrane receptor protein involved in Fe transport
MQEKFMNRSTRGTLGALLCVLLVAAVATLAFGQGIVTGSISGTVEDQQQAVVASAKVTAVQEGTNLQFTATTNETGFFTLRGLPVGKYTITIEAPTFAKTSVSGVTVNSGITNSLGTQVVKPGTSETVTVEGSAPLVQTDAVQVSSTYQTKQTADLPIGNGFDQLALFTPGVASAGSAGFSNFNGAEIAANGQRARSNTFQIDGQSNNDNSIEGPSIFFGNQDAIQEVQVLTNYSAEYGRSMGSQINYVTKAGTNSFHGTASEIYEGNWAQSFDNAQKSPVLGFCGNPPTPGCTQPVMPRFVDNRFGGTIGGPIIKDKLWFFASTNQERQRLGQTDNSTGTLILPTGNGISQLQAAFPGNAAVAALASIGPTAVPIGVVSFTDLQTVPVSDGIVTAPVEFGVVHRRLASLFNDYEASGRVDWQISSKDRFFGRYIFQQTLNTNLSGTGTPAATAVGDFIDLPARDQQIGLDWARTWTDHFLNQVRFSYSRAGFGFEGGAFPNCTRANILAGCPTNLLFGDGVTAGFGVATNLPQGRLINVSQWQDNASYIHGRHTIKFGGEYDRQRSPNVFLPDVNGAFTFADFDSFLQNTAAALNIAAGPPQFNFREQDLAFYAQDDWRVRDNLTLTFGLRWEFETQAINLLNDLTVARESNPATAFWDTTLPLSLRTVPSVPNDMHQFGPVVGFAYTPHIWKGLFGEDKTVIRGGFRIAYDPEFYNVFLNVATSTPSVNLGQAVNGPGGTCVNCLTSSGNGGDIRAASLALIPFGVNPGTRSQSVVSSDYHNPYSQQWNLGIQRELGSKMVAEVRYVGNHSVGLFQDVNFNPALNALIANGFASVIPAGLTPCATPGTPGFAQGFVDCNRTRVFGRANTSFSIYHSLQSNLRISNWHGVTAGVSYTFSKTIDNASEVFSNISGGTTLAFPQNPFNGNQPERGISGIDYPHVFSLYMLYDLPFYKSQQGLKGRLLGGWEVNPIYRYTSGQPYTVVSTRFVGSGSTLCDSSRTFSSTFSACRPILSAPGAAIDTVGQCTNSALPDCGLVDFFTGNPINAAQVHWIVNDTTAAQFFGTPFAGAGRNLQRGDTINNVSLAVLKNVKLNERVSMQLRLVAYNVLNRQFRGVPDPLVDDGNFSETKGSFGNTFFNPSGGDSVNTLQSGIGVRLLEVGAKIIF